MIRDTAPALHLGRCNHAAWSDWLYRIRHLTRSQRGICSQGRTLYFDSLAVLKRKRRLWHREGARLLVKVPLGRASSTSAVLRNGGFNNVVSLSGGFVSVESAVISSRQCAWPVGWRCDVANGFTASTLLKSYQCSQRQCDLTPVPLWLLKDCRQGRTLILRNPEGEVAGGAAVVFFRNAAGARDFLLFGVFVMAAYRGRGFGERLVNQVLGLPEVVGSRMGFIMLEQSAVIEFYARFGFMAADHFGFLYCDGYSKRVR